MKHIYLLLLLLAASACQTEDPLDEAMPPVQRATRSAEEPISLVLYARAQDIGSLVVGEPLNNYLKTFTVQNMGDAVMSLKWRRPIDPTDDRFGQIADEMINFSPYQIEPTHHYLVFKPKTLEDLAVLTADKTLYFSPVPLDREITGNGTIAHAPAEFDPATETTRIVGYPTALYVFYPVSKPLPAGIEYEVLAAHLYMPHMLTQELAEAAGTPFISATFADMLLQQAQLLSGYKTREELQAEIGWLPSGYVRVYDTELDQYVGVPHVRVHAHNNGSDICMLTDKNGYFQMPSTEQPFKGPVSYCVEFGNDDYVIHNGTGNISYYYCNHNKTVHPLNLNIRDGEVFALATLARALSLHYYGNENPLDRITDYTSTRFNIYYLHEYDSENKYAGLTSYDGETRITIWGLNKDKILLDSKDFISNLFHELGHATMRFGFLHAGLPFAHYDNIIKESWAKFTGWYFLKAEYKKFSYEILPYKLGSDGNTYEIPCWENVQNMTQETFQTDPVYKDYTPLFIDLMDESNQHSFYQLYPRHTGHSSKDVFPDDDIVIGNPILIELIMSQSKNLAALKAYLLKNKEALNITEENINKYFTFYGI